MLSIVRSRIDLGIQSHLGILQVVNIRQYSSTGPHVPPRATAIYAKSIKQISPNRFSINEFILERESVEEFIPGSS